jgi:hypothetical protein
MSGNTLTGGEEDATDKITFRLNSNLKERFKEQSDNMSAELEAYVRQRVGEPTDEYPREPPRERELRRAYTKLCEVANKNGVIRNSIAKRHLSGGPRSISADDVENVLLHSLRNRGYLRLTSDPTGRNRSWHIRGWNDGD